MGTSLPSDVYTNAVIGGKCNTHGGQKCTHFDLKITDHMDDIGVYGKTSVCL